MVVAGVVGPAATLPQIYKLYVSHSQHALGLSLTTWSLYTFLAMLWTFYGLVHKDPAIWVGNGLGTLAYLSVSVGIVLKAGWTF